MKRVINGLTIFNESHSNFKVMDYKGDDKEALIAYMRSFEPCAAGPMVDDCVTGKQTTIPNAGYEDAEYSWTTQDIYHIEKYDAAVDPDFLKHVKSIQLEQGIV